MKRKREIPLHLAAKLRAIRQTLGLSQYQMLERLGLDCYYGRISDYELGKRVPNLLTVLAYARASGVDMASIVDDTISLDAVRKECRARRDR